MSENWHCLTIKQIKTKLNTNFKGLNDQQAKKRLSEYGPNKLKEEAKDSPLKVFLSQFKDFLIIILITATAISFALGEVIDAFIILVIVLLSAILGFVQEYRSQKAVEALKKLAAPEALVLRNGKPLKILSENIVPGDIMLLAVGDKIAADARIFEEMGLEVNEAVLTGESLAVKKQNIDFKDIGLALGDRKNMLYAGTIVTRGHGKAIVVATGMETEFGKIATMISSVKQEETPLEKRLDKVGKVLGIGSIIVCAGAAGLGILRGYPVLEMFLWGVSLAVAAVPEALPAVVTGSLSIGVWEMAKRKAIVRRLPAVETLGSVSVICSDKTGTLTKNEMTVKQIYLSSKTVYVEGSGYVPEGTFLLKKGDYDWQKDEDLLKVCEIGLLCNDSTLSQKGKEWQVSGDPTEGALVVLAAKASFKKDSFAKKFKRVGEVAFDMSRKRMSTIHPLEKDKYLIAVKGAPESVISCCSNILINGEIKKLKAKDINTILKQTEDMAGKALRVLAIAYKNTDKKNLATKLTDLKADEVEKDLVFVGLVGMIDPPREEAADAIKSALLAGIKPIIVTGDHALTTFSIGRQIGLFKENKKNQIIESHELDKMSDQELLKIVDKRSYARVSPAHKLRIIKMLKKKGYIVAMTGDGINDAPALKKADIGISMGITGTDVTKEASSMVLADDNFATIIVAIKKGREIYDNIKKYLFYLLRCNVGEILVLGGGFLLGLPPVLSAVQILWINLVTDGLPALALGVDPPDKDVMKRKPADPGKSIFSKKALSLMVVLSINMAVVLLPQFSILIKKTDLVRAQTIVFITMVLMELVNAYNSKSEGSIFKTNMLNNKWLNLAVLASLLATFVVVQIPFFSNLFGTVALTYKEWSLAFLLSLSAFVFAEGGKFALKSVN
ncbi:cation-translocating P-type ATPase [Patescibacteria group bacterium]